MKKKIVSMLMVLCMMVSESMYIFAENEGKTSDIESQANITNAEISGSETREEIHVEIEKVQEEVQVPEKAEQPEQGMDLENTAEEDLTEESSENNDDTDDKADQEQQTAESTEKTEDAAVPSQQDDMLDESEDMATNEAEIAALNNRAAGVPIIATGIYPAPTSLLINDTVFASGALDASASNADYKWGQLTRVPLECIDKNGNRLRNVRSIAVGAGYSLFLKWDGTVWGTGYNDYSKLGTGDGNFRSAAVPVYGPGGQLSEISSISAGFNHSLAVDYEGYVWVWGSNSHGQFSTGDRIMSKYPYQLSHMNNIEQACAGRNYTVLLTDDGTVYTAGCNDKGQLGDGTKEDRTRLVQVKGLNGEGYLSHIRSIAVGDGCVVALDNEGTVWTWGSNDHGRLGNGTTTESLTPVKVLKEDGTELDNIVSVAAGAYHSLAISASGELWSWGYNKYGQLGIGTSEENQPYAVKTHGINGEGYLNNVVQVVGGDTFTMAACADGGIYTWGFNDKGQFGTGELDDVKLLPVPAYTKGCVPDDHGDSLDAATLERTHSTTYGYINSYLDIDCFKIIPNTSGRYRIETKDDVTLDLYNALDEKLDEKYGGYFLEANTAYYIKATSMDPVDYTFRIEPQNPPVNIMATTNSYNWSAHSIVLQNGAVYGAGYDSYGQLGTGKRGFSVNTPSKMVDEQGKHLTNAVKASAGDQYTLIQRSDGTVWAAGWNEYNKLGIEFVDGKAVDYADKAKPVKDLTDVVDISAGRTHSLALKADGTVWAWGSSSHGQLGGGNRVMQTFPTQVPNLTDVVSIKAGDQTSMALKSDGTVWMWGKNDQKQLGAGYTANEVMSPVQVKGENGYDYLTNIKAIAMTEKCSFALDKAGQVWAWGNNTNGALGIGTQNNTDTPKRVVKEDGKPLINMKSISAGDYHCGAVGYNGRVWIWGKNSSRQLGDKTKIDRYSAINPKGLDGTGTLDDVESISCGVEYTMAIQRDGKILAWGYNRLGQFGINSEIHEMYDRPIEAFFVPSETTPVILPIEQGEEYIVWITGKNISEAEKNVLMLFEAEALEIVDLCLQTYENELVPGTVPGGQVTIGEFDPGAGRLAFAANHAIPENKLYHGLLNAIKVRAKITGETRIVVSR